MDTAGELTEAIVAFLERIGLVVRRETIEGPTVLPGITVDHGALVLDSAALRHPGDLLHEAGHLAVLSAAERAAVVADVGDDGGLEMGAIAWSWAAAVANGWAPDVVFHAEGYRGGSASLIENFCDGHFLGVPILEWKGLALSAARAAADGREPYPAMQRWLAA